MPIEDFIVNDEEEGPLYLRFEGDNEEFSQFFAQYFPNPTDLNLANIPPYIGCAVFDGINFSAADFLNFGAYLRLTNIKEISFESCALDENFENFLREFFNSQQEEISIYFFLDQRCSTEILQKIFLFALDNPLCKINLYDDWRNIDIKNAFSLIAEITALITREFEIEEPNREIISNPNFFSRFFPDEAIADIESLEGSRAKDSALDFLERIKEREGKLDVPCVTTNLKKRKRDDGRDPDDDTECATRFKKTKLAITV